MGGGGGGGGESCKLGTEHRNIRYSLLSDEMKDSEETCVENGVPYKRNHAVDVDHLKEKHVAYGDHHCPVRVTSREIEGARRVVYRL